MYRLFDKFLSNSLSPKEEETLTFLLEDNKNRKAFKAYLKDQRDTYAALQEPDLRVAYKKIKGFSKAYKDQSLRFLNINWFKFVAVLFISIYIPNGIYTDSNNAFSSSSIKKVVNPNCVKETFKTHTAFNYSTQYYNLTKKTPMI